MTLDECVHWLRVVNHVRYANGERPFFIDWPPSDAARRRDVPELWMHALGHLEALRHRLRWPHRTRLHDRSCRINYVTWALCRAAICAIERERAAA